jgi:hypothetical protein
MEAATKPLAVIKVDLVIISKSSKWVNVLAILCVAFSDDKSNTQRKTHAFKEGFSSIIKIDATSLNAPRIRSRFEGVEPTDSTRLK